MDKDIINEIDVNTCEWRTGVEHCGDYECMINKCCDLNCDWYKRRKLEQLLQAKEQECEYLIKQRDKFEYGNNILEHERNKHKQALDEIEEFCIVYSSNHDAYEMVYKHILGIINKAKDSE